MAERPVVQAELAASEARLRAARAMLREAIDEAWARATGTGEVPTDQRAALRLAATHAATTGAEVTTSAYKLGGGSAVYESRSALPRRFRDAHTATQHMLVAPATNELAGRLMLGLPTDTSQL
jgi:alkylation response protein AidB-like acyl-CoA dehydrogenase